MGDSSAETLHYLGMGKKVKLHCVLERTVSASTQRRMIRGADDIVEYLIFNNYIRCSAPEFRAYYRSM